ncbi:hypothetical protein TIFTF001_024707 [Ficus carica]|uniref:Uncharacterized protein n=1 Tax=Ficus carica TaxID=3494 RepID=A0AA88DH04_FICCA|nr:hypothetical protein TIFTF001_024707 [Ficus carica]
MKKIYRRWKALQVRIGLGYDPSINRVICSDDAWQSFIQVHNECNHLRHEGLRHKELYYNIFEKNHAVVWVRNLLRLTIVGNASTEERAMKLVRHGLGAVPVRESKERQQAR